MESNQKKLVNIFYEEIWNENNLKMVPEVLDKDLTFRGSIGEIKNGHAGFIEYHALITNALKNYKCKTLLLIEEENKISAKMEFSGLHTNTFLGCKPTNKNIIWVGVAIFSFNKSKISDIWVLSDLTNLLGQLSGEENA